MMLGAILGDRHRALGWRAPVREIKTRALGWRAPVREIKTRALGWRAGWLE
jgi:hypothetical protein